MNERKQLNKDECESYGGHSWNYHSASMVVNKFGEPTGISNAMMYVGLEPYYRTCKLCGLRQQEIPQTWEDIN